MRARNEQGIALVTVLLMLMLVSALLVSTTALVIKDSHARSMDHDRTSTFYAAHGGLEKLTNDLGRLFAGNYAPTDSQINTLMEAPPVLDGVTFDLPGPNGAGKGYTISRKPAENKTLSSGDYVGLKGIVTPYTVSVTAKSPGDSEVTLMRTVNSVAIPVFQFGIFSETDLSFFPGPEFNFGGKVHTNGNLWLAKGTNDDLILADKVTAWKDVIRTELSNTFNTVPAGNGYAGKVRVLTTPGGCKKPFTEASCKQMTMTEGSLNAAMEPNTANNAWKTASEETFKNNIKNGDGGKGGKANSTGAVKLTLPITQHGAKPIDLIRRAAPNENTANPNLYLQRYYQLASVRILLSDYEDDLNNLPDKATGSPVNLATHADIAKAGSNTAYLADEDQPLVSGYIKVEMQNQAGGAWTDVTAEWLGEGFTGRPVVANGTNCVTTGENAIIRLQRVRDSSTSCTDTKRMVPNVLYDPREGRDRDVNTDPSVLYLGGVMHYVELDILQLREWLADKREDGLIMETTGYVVYFSDRRNNHNGTGVGTETGEYGFEDVVNRNNSTTPDAGEDTSGSGATELYGATPITTLLPEGHKGNLTTTARPWTTISVNEARWNRAVLFRRALKLVNGNRTNMLYDKPADDPHGLTIVAENPVYIQGDYNADTPGSGAPDYTTDHVACAVIADAVTLLSRNWLDSNSFTNPTNKDGRRALTTTYRTAIVSGKGLSFPRPNGTANDFGTDGGTHNFLRFIEGWDAGGGQPKQTINYKGSIVSLYYNHQANGTYKCCTTVYSPPNRQFFFDDDFLDPDKLPPRTPMFRAIDVTSFSRMNEPPPPPPAPPTP